MTLTPSDLELSAPAAARLEEYLVQVRAALSGAPDVSPDEIEADIRDHVENELSSVPKPVSLSALEVVLTKLGPPSQWGAAPDPTVFRRVGHLLREHLRNARTATTAGAKRVGRTLWSGPEDWRLAYLSFGLFALGVLTFFVLFPVTLVVSYVLSRAGLAHARERGIELGAGRKWLLYPPVVLVSLALLIAVAAWPVVAGIGTAHELAGAASRVREFDRPDPPAHTSRAYRDGIREQKERLAAQVEQDRKLLAVVPVSTDFAPVVGAVFVGLGALLLWWTIIGALGAHFPYAVRALFSPLCDHFDRSHGTRFGLISFFLLIAWIGTALRVLD